MSTNTLSSNAERFGNWLGRGWRGFVRQERQVADWLVAQGVPAAVATALLWIAKLVVLGVLLYVAFWLAMLVVVAVFAAWTTEQRNPEEAEEWHFVDLNELRKSPGYDPNLYNDTSHELYEDD